MTAVHGQKPVREGGFAHAVPARQVVAGFGPISVDNRRVIRQEWLAEAFMMWGTAAIAAAAAGAGGRCPGVGVLGRGGAAGGAGHSDRADRRGTPVVWFKICPVLLGGAAGLVLAASWL